jgi:hypothetical protein
MALPPVVHCLVNPYSLLAVSGFPAGLFRENILRPFCQQLSWIKCKQMGEATAIVQYLLQWI